MTAFLSIQRYLSCSSVENMKAEVWEHHTPDLTGVRKVTVCKVEREELHKEIVNRLRKATSLES